MEHFQILSVPNLPRETVASRRVWVKPHRLIQVGHSFTMRLFCFGHGDRLASVRFVRGLHRIELPLMFDTSLDCSSWLGLIFIPKALKRDQRGRIKAILLECHAVTKEVQFA